MSNKKKNRKIPIVIGFFFALFILFNLINHTNGPKINDVINESEPNKKLFTSGPLGYTIHINDTDPTKNWTYTNTTYDWCTGSGTYVDPYVIRDVEIDAMQSGSGITIENSTKMYFRIENCTVYNSSSDFGDAGIAFNNTNNGTIVDCNCSNNGGDGIFLENSHNNTLFMNIVNDSYVGIGLYRGSANNTVRDNNVTSNYLSGIALNWAVDNKILRNNASENEIYGIAFSFCDRNLIANNTIGNYQGYKQMYGMYIWDSDYNNITGNTILENWQRGISFFTDSENNIVYDNTIGNLNLGPLGSIWGIYLDDNCDNNNISDNRLIKNYNTGIKLYDNCDLNTIMGNEIEENGENGMHLGLNCNNNTIAFNIVKNNAIIENASGIFLNSSSNNTISYNNIFNNKPNYQDSGINITNSCYNNTVSSNNISHNQDYGIYIDQYCDSNLIYNNTLLNNTVNGYDDGNFNKWDNGSLGNFWDDYESKYPSGTYNGMFWVPPYVVDGGSSAQDNFPLGQIFINYTETGNVSVIQDTSGLLLNWTTGIINGTRDTYDILIDGSVDLSGQNWDSTLVQYSVPASTLETPGDYNITCIIRNDNAWSAQSQINLTVEASGSLQYDSITKDPFVEGSSEFIRWLCTVHADATPINYSIIMNDTTILYSNLTLSKPLSLIQFNLSELRAGDYNLTCNYTVRSDSKYHVYSSKSLTFTVEPAVIIENLNASTFVMARNNTYLFEWNVTVHAEASPLNYSIIYNSTIIDYTNTTIWNPTDNVIWDLSSLEPGQYNITCNVTVKVGIFLFTYESLRINLTVVDVRILNLNLTEVEIVQTENSTLEWSVILDSNAIVKNYSIIFNDTIIAYTNTSYWNPADNIVYNLSLLSVGDYNTTCKLWLQFGSNFIWQESVTIALRVERAVIFTLQESPGADPVRFTSIRIIWNTTVHSNATAIRYKILNETLFGYMVYFINDTVWDPQNQVIYVNSSFDFGYYRLILNITLRIGDHNISVQSEIVVFTISNHAPTIDDLADTGIYYGQKGLGITWTPVDVDENYNKYTIYIDDVKAISGDWDGSNITYVLDNLTIGTYDIKCMVNDTFGLSVSTVVEVKISQNLAPSIQAVSDFTIYIFDTNKSIRWTTSDSNGNYDHYEIYVNGVLNVTAKWVYSRISLSLDQFTVGIYNITLVVYDIMDLSDEDSVIVTISESLPGGDLIPDNIVLLIILVGAGVGAAAVIIYITRLKTHKMEVSPKKEIKIPNDLISEGKKLIKKEKLSGKKPKK